jgi:hypothetical protein
MSAQAATVKMSNAFTLALAPTMKTTELPSGVNAQSEGNCMQYSGMMDGRNVIDMVLTPITTYWVNLGY